MAAINQFQHTNRGFRLTRVSWILPILLGFLSVAPAFALEFPGPTPGPASAMSSNGAFSLENEVLKASWIATNGHLAPASVRNKLDGEFASQAGAELFRLSYLRNGVTQQLAASEFTLASGPELRLTVAATNGSRVGDRLAGRELVAQFRHDGSGLAVDWRAILRDGANYLRFAQVVSTTNTGVDLLSVDLLDYRTTNAPLAIGSWPGNPWVAGQVFLGGETPFFTASEFSGGLRLVLGSRWRSGAGLPGEFTSVVGVYPTNQLRRAFLYYLERERARPYGQVLNWNTWLDSLLWVNEGRCLEVWTNLDLELRQRRGVKLDAFALDDAWDDPLGGFWQMDSGKFPDGLTVLSEAAHAQGTGIGLWISPLGGYDYSKFVGYNACVERGQRAIEAGIIYSNLDLSLPTYYQWWVNRARAWMQVDNVVYFKWDRAGGEASPHFLALLRAAEELHAASTNLFLSGTVGTWPSPFWLHSLDLIWRGGLDAGNAGEGDDRERYLTYCDAQLYANVTRASPLTPLTSLLAGSLIHGGYSVGISLGLSGTNLAHAARQYFGSGTQLQELSLSPEWMNHQSWDQVAEAVRWARTNQDVLVDTHWVGGDPALGQVYGYGAWSSRKGTLVLRNPTAQTNSILLDIGTALDLPAGALTNYDLAAAYPDQSPPFAIAQAGWPRVITLPPFEVLVLDAWPRPAGLPVPPEILSQPPPTLSRYQGATVSMTVTAFGSAPLSYQWKWQGSPLAGETNATLALPAVSLAQAGTYTLNVSNAAGVAETDGTVLSVPIPGQYGTVVSGDHPVAWWRLGESNPPVILDSWGLYDGSVLGSVGFGQAGAVTNDPDTAIRFWGTNGSAVESWCRPGLNPAAFSIECWARPVANTGSARTVLSCRDGAAMRGFAFLADTNNVWRFVLGDGAAWRSMTGPPGIRGHWAHLLGTYDGTNQCFYVNGQIAGSAMTSFAPNLVLPLRIGGEADAAIESGCFSGDLDEVALYNHALAPTRVQAHYLPAPFLFDPSRLVIEREGTNLVLTWFAGQLETATWPTGVWTSVSGAISPMFLVPAARSSFYRLRLQ